MTAKKKPRRREEPLPGIDPQPGEVAWDIWFVTDDGGFYFKAPLVLWSATWHDARHLAAGCMADLFPDMTPLFRAEQDRARAAHRRGEEPEEDKRVTEALRLLGEDGNPDDPPSPEVLAKLDPGIMAVIKELRALADSPKILAVRTKGKQPASAGGGARLIGRTKARRRTR